MSPCVKVKMILLSAITASFCLSSVAWGNPHGLSSNGYWALHLPFDLEPSEVTGGKYLAMGGAALAVADDVRASALNPAGLSALRDMQLAVDISYSSYEKDYMDTYASVNNIGLGPDLDEFRTFDDSIADLSFAGAAMQVVPGKLTASVYYRSSAFTGSDNQNSGPEPVFDSTLNLLQENISEKNIEEYRKRSYGIAAAFNYSELFSFGAAVSLETLNTNLREMWTTNTYTGSVHDSSISYGGIIDGNDNDFSFSLGMLFKPASDISAALSYRKGSSFSIDYSSVETTCSLSSCDDAIENLQAIFDTPDIWSVGVAWYPVPNWLLTAQADWVGYSALADASTSGNTLDEEIDDGVILRFGTEKTFIVSNSLNCQIRAGLFRIPDHDGFQAIDSDQMYYTLGGGVNWNKDIKVDIGASFSEDSFNSVLSLTYSL
ncbi:Long-chain fatty acid transport protein [Candidatus Electronema halotolerans]